MKRLIGSLAAAAVLAPAAADAAPDLLRLGDRDRVKDCTTCDRTADRDRLRDGTCEEAVVPLRTGDGDQDRTKDRDRDRVHLWDDGAPWWSALFGR